MQRIAVRCCHGKFTRNPLQHIQKAQSNGRRARPRQAFTHEEVTRLLKIAGPRKVVYLTAVFTGLRRKELTALEWDNVHLDAESPFLNVRASTTKNHQQALISLHQDISTELRRLKSPARSSKSKRVFECLMQTMETFKADLVAAKIELLNDKGQRADFHSLRHTLATNLALVETAPRVAMEIMRHSDMRLTARTYTDAGLLPVSDAGAKLPSFTNPNVKTSQKLFRAHPDKSTLVNKSAFQNDSEISENEKVKPLSSISVQTGQENEKWCAVQGLNL